ncbi:beta-1,3-glucan-binding protein-like [Harmonia axyridis]|uniref:beta-1,3-glucan-binding protein-like n=1 Tax=Harmonia axyridis TaxID=115357 RepID=UPI001E276081|nr:beta-1,3-glucan-binding protein-like [Harmonia axyridis]XP_045463337.1 beta-1,3-glucan-binding protein-like [Harmonia axyridis]
MKNLLTILSLVFELVSKSNQKLLCPESLTTVSGTSAPKGRICSGDLIFQDNFETFNLDVWQHEQTLGGGGNWEFQWYTNNRTISYVDEEILKIKPRLLADDTGESFLYSGTLDINGGSPSDECTNPAWYGCSRTGSPQTVINPIKSARIRTLNSFRFKYGELEARIKIPSGDWLWPALWLLPRNNQYGGWPSSGEIDIMESRGNKDLIDSTGKNIGSKLASSTLHWGPSTLMNKYTKTHYEQSSYEGFDQEWHIYQMVWTPDNITFKIDNQTIGTASPPEGGFWEMGDFSNTNMVNPWRGGSKMAPFDQEFYIVLNLAVGGTSFFPDGANNSGGQKPWSNKSPRASGDFWEGRNQWLPTWKMGTDDQTLKIDYVKVWAL